MYKYIKKKGFTLIEIMIVILIMGITLGLVSLIGKPNIKTQLKKDAQYLGELLDLVHYESQIQNKNMYIDIANHSIEFEHSNMPSSTQQFLQGYKWQLDSVLCNSGCVSLNNQANNINNTNVRIELTPEPVQLNLDITFSKDNTKMLFQRLGDGSYNHSFLN